MAQLESIDDTLLKKVLAVRENATFEFSKEDVLRVLEKERLSVDDMMVLLSESALECLELMCQKSQEVTRRYFGNSIALFTPLYISNFCDNLCVYCGFNSKNDIKRLRLDDKAIREELLAISKTGLKEILILTGESQTHSDIAYIANAAFLARKHFSAIGLEIYPTNSKEYETLHAHGVDFITVFQETYNPQKYAKVHLLGNKSVFEYRFQAQERALMGGMRGVGFGALFGLDDYQKDALSCAYHASLVQKKFPHAEIALSVPRLRPIKNNKSISANDVDEKRLLQIMCAYRLFLPFASITISTRERKGFRNAVLKIAATKISAGVNVGIGKHSGEEGGDAQFEISDEREVEEMHRDILEMGLQAVFKDYEYV